MATRYSTNDVMAIVKELETEAKLAGLIPQDSELLYTAGNASNGITGTVMCYRKPNGYEVVREADDFLPEFNYKMTRTDHARLLQATLRVFLTMRRNHMYE